MKSQTDIISDLNRLVEAHYYSEDYELEWAGKAYYDELTEEDRKRFEEVLVQRLSGRPSLSDISVCTRLGRPSLTPILANLLDREANSSAMSRAILAALSHQPDEMAYVSVERFMDSEQEGEALCCLARMNFRRALPHLRWAIQKEHLHNFCLHALHEFKREVGLETLAESVRELISPDPDRLSPHVRKILTSKQGRYNPFAEEELELLSALLV